MNQTIAARSSRFIPISRLAALESGLKLPVWLLVLYPVIEYGRPAFLVPLKPGLVLQLALVLCLATKTAQVNRLLREKYFQLYLLMLVLMAVHVPIAVNNYWAFVCMKTMFSYLVISIAICIFLNTPRRMRAFLFAFVSVIALCAVNRIFKANLLGLSGTGVFTDENDFALAMNVALPLGFFLGQIDRGWRKWLLWGACILLVLGNVVSSSRGGVIGLAAVALVCWYYMQHKLRMLFVIGAVAILAWNYAAPEFRQEVSELSVDSTERDTGKDRIELWKTGLRAFVDNPVIGVGQGNIPIVINRYQHDRYGNSYWDRDMWGRALHSVYLTLLSELGLVGTLLVGFMLRELLRKHRETGKLVRSRSAGSDGADVDSINRALATSLFGFLVTGLFLSVFYYPPFWNIAALMVGLHLMAGRLAEEKGAVP